MSHKKRTKRNWIFPVGFFLFFLVSFWMAREDRTYKAWRADNQALFLSFSWVKQWSQMNLPVNSEILIDYSRQKKIVEQFKPSLAGKMRYSLYAFLYRDMKKHILVADIITPDFRIERINQSKNYIKSNKVNMEDLNGIDPNDFNDHKRIMEENGIDYFIFQFSDWRQQRRIMDSIGFNMLYSNAHFMLLSLKKPNVILQR